MAVRMVEESADTELSAFRRWSITFCVMLITMMQVLDRKLTSQHFTALLLGVFGGVALLLAAVGIYSVLSYIVRGRGSADRGRGLYLDAAA